MTTLPSSITITEPENEHEYYINSSQLESLTVKVSTSIPDDGEILNTSISIGDITKEAVMVDGVDQATFNNIAPGIAIKITASVYGQVENQRPPPSLQHFSVI